MNIVRTDIDKLNATIAISIEKSDYERQVEKILKNHQKNAVMDGFRKGKVPMGMIKKLYGTQVLVEEVNKLVSNKLFQYIVDEKINILGEPLPNEELQKEIDWKQDTDFELIYDIALSPEYELSLTKKDKVANHPIKIDAKMLKEGVNTHSRRFGENVQAETVSEKDLLKGDFVEMAKVNPKKDGISKEMGIISLEYMKDEEILKSFVGAKKGDAITFDLKKAYPNDSDIASLLEIEKEEAANLNSPFRFTIKEILHFTPHEINQELFDKSYGEGTIKDEKEFEAKIKEEIAEQLSHDTAYKLSLDIKEKLLDKAKFDLPEAFLKRWLIATNENFTEEQVEKDFAAYSEDIRWQLIKDKLMKENEIKVEQEELIDTAKQVALMQFRQYGMMDVPEEHLTNYANQILANKEEARKLHDRKIEEKVIDLIKSKITVEDKEVTVDQFNKFFEPKK